MTAAKPPTLRAACPKHAFDHLDEYMNPDKECCRNCKYFAPCMMSSPAGWCEKYPSRQVNCSEFDVCDEFDKRVPIIGKCLGNSVTEQQLRAIRSGTFDQIEVGDYWYINGYKFIVVQKNAPEDNHRTGNLQIVQEDGVVIDNERND